MSKWRISLFWLCPSVLSFIWCQTEAVITETEMQIWGSIWPAGESYAAKSIVNRTISNTRDGGWVTHIPPFPLTFNWLRAAANKLLISKWKISRQNQEKTIQPIDINLAFVEVLIVLTCKSRLCCETMCTCSRNNCCFFTVGSIHVVMKTASL